MKASASEHSILLIGAGRLAKHLFYWNSLLSTPNVIKTWNRNEDPKILKQFLNESAVIWLAITDSAVAHFFDQHLLNYEGTVVHFSGALHDSRMQCAHPLMTFPKELMSDLNYQQIHFAVTGTTTLIDILPGFTNPFFLLPEKEKPLYHAMCVVAGNFPQLLWNEIEQKRKTLKIPETAFNIYLQQALNNFIKYKAAALTGPLIRNDLETMNKNIEALANTKLQSIYAAFVKEFSL